MELQIIQTKIFKLRGQLVMLDSDLAELYAVPTKVFNQAVKRNIQRFPEDFMFQLSPEEWQRLRSHFATLDVMWSQIVTTSRKYRRAGHFPYAFTEHGVAMLSSILNSPKAIETNIAIIRAFVALRHFALGYAELAQKIAELEARLGCEVADIHDVLRWLGEENQARHDEIQALPTPETEWENRPRIGFKK